jgi:hypothetical protein
VQSETKSILLILGGLAAATGAYAIYRSTRKAEPSPAQPKTLGPAPLDLRLAPDEREAVRTALAVETDPKQLVAFAESLLPDYPLSANALRARAASLGVVTSGSCCYSCMQNGPCEGG